MSAFFQKIFEALFLLVKHGWKSIGLIIASMLIA